MNYGPAMLALPLAQDHHDWDGGWWIVMAVGMVLFWALVIFAIVWIVRELSSRERPERNGEKPLAILDRRLADGTISVEEYRERRAILGDTPPKDSGGT